MLGMILKDESEILKAYSIQKRLKEEKNGSKKDVNDKTEKEELSSDFSMMIEKKLS